MLRGFRTDTHSGHEKFLDLVDGPLEFDLGPVVRVLHRDQDVEVLTEVLPVGLPSVHLLLKNTQKHFKKRRLNAPQKLGPSPRREGTGFHFSSCLAQFLDRPQTAHKHTHKAQGRGTQNSFCSISPHPTIPSLLLFIVCTPLFLKTSVETISQSTDIQTSLQ